MPVTAARPPQLSEPSRRRQQLINLSQSEDEVEHSVRAVNFEIGESAHHFGDPTFELVDCPLIVTELPHESIERVVRVDLRMLDGLEHVHPPLEADREFGQVQLSAELPDGSARPGKRFLIRASSTGPAGKSSSANSQRLRFRRAAVMAVSILSTAALSPSE